MGKERMLKEKFGNGSSLGTVSVEECRRLNGPWPAPLQIIAVIAGGVCLRPKGACIDDSVHGTEHHLEIFKSESSRGGEVGGGLGCVFHFCCSKVRFIVDFV